MSTVTRPSLQAIQTLGQIANGYSASSALNAIARLEIADLLQDKPMSIGDLAKRSSTNEDALCRALRLLCSVGVFEEVSCGMFANNETSSLLRRDSEYSQHDMVVFISDPFHFKAYADMLPTIRDGKTAAHHVWGKEIFDVLKESQEEQVLFNNAMTNFSNSAVAKVLDAYDFSSIGTLVDVAGGHGLFLSGILQKYPSMRGILFELEHVAPGARKHLESLNLSQRCEIATGDFFKSVPSGDAIIMKHIIHDWNDERAVAILKNCRKALSDVKGAKLLLVEMILAGLNEPHPSKFLDIEMLMLPGGRERSKEQFAELFKCAGFKLNRVAPTQGPLAVLEAIPE